MSEQLPIILLLCSIVLLLASRLLRQRRIVNRTTYSTTPEIIGKEGENTVYRYLKKLPEEYDIFNDVLLQYEGKSTQIDHIVVSRFGIYVIETKNMAGPIYGSENSEFWSEYLPETRYENRQYKFRNPIWQNEGHIKALRAVLQDSNVRIYGIVVFPKDTELNINVKKKVTTWDQIVHVITRYDELVMDGEDVLRYSALIGEANVIKPEAREEHVQSVRDNQARRDNLVAEGICPRCGGRLVERDGKYGRFLGCSNYPKCKYILK